MWEIYLRYSLNQVDFNKFNPPPSNRLDLNRWSGRVAERLVECYINEKLIPKIQQEEFDSVFFDIGLAKYFMLPFSGDFKLLLMGEKKLDWKKIYEETVTELSRGGEVIRKNGEWVNVTEDEKNKIIKQYEYDQKLRVSKINDKIMLYYLLKGVIPDKKLFAKTLGLLLLLNVWTDGFLIKMKKTNKVFKTKELISMINYNELTLPIRVHNMLKRHKFPKETYQVSGEIEFIEIKSNKAFIPTHQIDNYLELIEAGYKMRYFQVDTNSFQKNIFDIDEKILNDINDLKSSVTSSVD